MTRSRTVSGAGHSGRSEPIGEHEHAIAGDASVWDSTPEAASAARSSRASCSA